MNVVDVDELSRMRMVRRYYMLVESALLILLIRLSRGFFVISMVLVNL